MFRQDKIVVITRATRLEQLVARYNTWPQAKFYLQHMDLDPAEYQDEHETYQTSLMRVRRQVERLDRPVQVMERSLVPNYLFGPDDVVVTVGPDGLVVNTAKYLRGQCIVPINPDPMRIDGILLPLEVSNCEGAVQAALAGQAKIKEVTMAEAALNDGQRLLAFNDFLVGHRSHVSARYRLRLGNQTEVQSSSGILVSTGAGSTGWLSSVRNMAISVSRMAGNGQAMQLPSLQMAWDDPHLMFVVREPFASRATGIDLTCGKLKPGERLIIESQMGEGGVIFSDGVEADAMQFNAGAVATIGTAQHKARLVIQA
jgi:NAD kinase